MTASPAEARALELLEAWNRRDLAAFEGLLARDVSWYDPSMPHPPAVGREAVLEFSRAVLTAFPDFSYAIRAPICASRDGQSCAIPWRIRATHRAALSPPGFAPTGQQIVLDGVDLLSLSGDLVGRIETYFDLFQAASQALAIHLRPPPHSFRERLMVRAQRLRAAWLRRRCARQES